MKERLKILLLLFCFFLMISFSFAQEFNREQIKIDGNITNEKLQRIKDSIDSVDTKGFPFKKVTHIKQLSSDTFEVTFGEQITTADGIDMSDKMLVCLREDEIYVEGNLTNPEIDSIKSKISLVETQGRNIDSIKQLSENTVEVRVGLFDGYIIELRKENDKWNITSIGQFVE